MITPIKNILEIIPENILGCAIKRYNIHVTALNMSNSYGKALLGLRKYREWCEREILKGIYLTCIFIFFQDSPTNKLLFAKDIPKYRKWVERYYQEVRELPPVSEQDMNVAMTEISMVSKTLHILVWAKSWHNMLILYSITCTIYDEQNPFLKSEIRHFYLIQSHIIINCYKYIYM